MTSNVEMDTRHPNLQERLGKRLGSWGTGGGRESPQSLHSRSSSRQPVNVVNTESSVTLTLVATDCMDRSNVLPFPLLSAVPCDHLPRPCCVCQSGA